MNRGFRSWVALASAGVALVGCGGSGASSSLGPQSAAYRAINASPDTRSLDVFVSGQVKASSLPYGTATADFQPIKAGSYDIGLRPSGESFDAWTEAENLGSQQNAVLAAIGLKDFGDEYQKRLRLATFTVDRATPNGNKSRLYVLNALVRPVGFANESVDFKTPGNNPQISLNGVAFGEAKNLVVDSGVESFEFRVSDTEDALATGNIDLAPGKIYILVLEGFEGATGDQAPAIREFEVRPR